MEPRHGWHHAARVPAILDVGDITDFEAGLAVVVQVPIPPAQPALETVRHQRLVNKRHQLVRKLAVPNQRLRQASGSSWRWGIHLQGLLKHPAGVKAPCSAAFAPYSRAFDAGHGPASAPAGAQTPGSRHSSPPCCSCFLYSPAYHFCCDI